MMAADTPRKIKIKWPQLDITVTAILNDDINPSLVNLLYDHLPYRSLQNHALVSGDHLYHLVPSEKLIYTQAEHMVPDRTTEPDGTVFLSGLQHLAIKYGPLTEYLPAAPCGNVVPEDMEKLRSAGLGVWKACNETKRVIEVIVWNASKPEPRGVELVLSLERTGTLQQVKELVLQIHEETEASWSSICTELSLVHRGMAASHAGSKNSYFATMVFINGEIRPLGYNILNGILKVAALHPHFDLQHLASLYQVFASTPSEFVGYTGARFLTSTFRNINTAINELILTHDDQVEARENFLALISAFAKYTNMNFPNDPIFTNLLHHAKSKPDHVISDPGIGVQATYSQLLADVVSLCRLLKQALSEFLTVEGNYLEEDVYICIVGTANYEFAAAGFAILALGGIIVPLRFLQRAEDIQISASELRICPINIAAAIAQEKSTPPCHLDVSIDFNIIFPSTRPGFVFWSSGSTSTPKGIIHSRRILHHCLNWGWASDDVSLIPRPTRFGGNLLYHFAAAMVGCRAEVIDSEANPEMLWDRIVENKVTRISSAVPFFEILAKKFRDNIACLPPERKDRYLQATRRLKWLQVGGYLPSISLLKYWTDVIGKPLTVLYGSTELAAAITETTWSSNTPERSIGRELPEYTIKLSEGDHGEILIKGPHPLLGYLNHKIPLSDVLDEEGFYKSGDLAHKSDGQYIFDGRISTDYIKTPKGTIAVLQLEEAIVKLPYISEAYVLPVLDGQRGTQVAALIRLTQHEEPATHNLTNVRADLQIIQVPLFMLPTALYILKDKDSVPKTESEEHISNTPSYPTSIVSRYRFSTTASKMAGPSEYKLNGATPSELQDGGKVEVEVEGLQNVKLLLVKLNGQLQAMSARCTHYGAPLVKGVLSPDGRLTCPWHGACFNTTTGDIEDAPAPLALNKYEVYDKDGVFYVKGEEEYLKAFGRTPVQSCKAIGEDKVVVVGGGSGGFGTIEMLREQGYNGHITLISQEPNLPLDRTKLSKALIADASKLELRSKEWYSAVSVDVVSDQVTAVDFEQKSVSTKAGTSFPYTKLVLATGGTPRRLPLPGFKDLGNIFVLRYVADVQQILDAVGDKNKNVVVIGSSFIGMEVGNALAKENKVSIVGMESAPLERVMGAEIGRIFQSNLENAGVKFYMSASVEKATPSSADSSKVGSVLLKDGTELPADLVILGVGVSPATEYLRNNPSIELERDGSLRTDESFLVTGLNDVYAIGDIASYPYHGPGGGQGGVSHVRIEHWNVAQNAGRSVGRTIAHSFVSKQPLKPKSFIPIFWSALGQQLRYCGNTMNGYDGVIIRGEKEKAKFAAFYTLGDTVVAVASMGMDPLVSKSADLMRRGNMPGKKELDAGVDVLAIV
ncbi:hypothetical protein FQN57_000755 [Myotisia sp. PD_48]|nr:hypothetical protein FQN57_000755 [Myotisia sp. PD_48]